MRQIDAPAAGIPDAAHTHVGRMLAVCTHTHTFMPDAIQINQRRHRTETIDALLLHLSIVANHAMPGKYRIAAALIHSR